MKYIALAAVAAVAAAPAFAGNVSPAPVEAPVFTPAAPMAAGFNWTGAYAGAQVGYGALNLDFDGIEDEANEEFNFFDDTDANGAIGGVNAAYLYDFGSFVAGAELALNAGNLDFDQDNNDGSITNAEVDSLHQLKAKFGYDAGRTLVYGVAGVAYAEADFNDISYEDTGYVVGVGVDYAITDNVIVGGEVNYNGFDDFDDTGIDADVTTVQAKVAYKF
ncbi:outer membrane protein [Profundibacterium mesophilum]|uniref:Outer membrane protein n=1 Tax=Profundibacterium mesophilum KAUST100406-0324 TaxID=1037889 RepID=A0A921TEP7_9RHOB|nr:outer membrane beta-barrel protein [Profundibacterium mesophilum]KAF0677521.1 Outer membrane protein [Profundibacterium mesophilum KAUST100406-0324]